MLKQLKSAIQLLLILQGCWVCVSSVLLQKVNATPVPTSALEKSCSNFKPIINAMPQAHSAIAPTQSTLEEAQPIASVLNATSNCASDLETTSVTPNQSIAQKVILTPLPEPPSPAETAPSEIPLSQPLENEQNRDSWRFIFQPYATIPINTYGSATVRGRTVDYHLSLGSLLQSLSMTASGRVEAWNGNWGFIIDGYFANLNAVQSFQKTEFSNLNTLNAVNYILNTDINGRLQGISDILEKQVQLLEKVDDLKNSQEVANLKVKVQDIKNQVTEDAQRIEAARGKLQNLQTLVDNNKGALENLVFKLDTFQDKVADTVTDLRNLALTVGDIQEETLARWQTLQDATIDTDLDRRQIKILIAKNIDTIKTIRDLDPLAGVRDRVSDRVQDISDKSQEVREKIESAKALGQAIDQKVDEIRSVRDIEQLKTKLAQTRDLIQETKQKIETLRTIKDSVDLAALQNKLQTLQTLLEKELAVIEQVRNFANNPNNRDLTLDTTSNLSFNQGIYDFAISYHFGDPVSDRLPKEASNREFPLVWFQPYLGTRLNDINLNLDQMINVKYTSELINFQGSYQQNFSQGKTWFEPLVGGKFGIQISDPITFWLRADVSGFDLAADSDWSWNALAGMDWWVNANTSLQLGYRFYQIKLRNGTGENAFGFSESFNGPFLSASFHF